MNDRRPRGWNHWAEVVFKDPLTPRFIGDAPHGWVGSDFLRAVRTLFVYEKPESLVMAAGLPMSWLEQGLSLRHMASEHGSVSLCLESEKVTAAESPGGAGKVKLTYKLSGDVRVPIELMVPLSAGSGDERKAIVVPHLPATVTVEID